MKDVTEIKRFSGNLAVSDIAIILTKHLIFALFGFGGTGVRPARRSIKLLTSDGTYFV